MASRYEETVDKKIARMAAKVIFEDNRDRRMPMAEINEICAESLIEIISGYPLWTARRILPPIARRLMKGKVRGIAVNDLPLLPGFEELQLGYRFAVPPTKAVETEVEAIDEESLLTLWIPMHVGTVHEYDRHVAAYIKQADALQKETALRLEVLNTARAIGCADDEKLIDVLARGT